MMSEVKAKDIMKSPIITASSSTTVDKIAKIMKVNGIGGVVIEKDGKLIGIVTKSDIIFRVVAEEKDPKKIKAEDIMSSPLHTVDVETSLVDIARKMAKENIRRIVVTRNNRPVGVLSDRDILKVAPEVIEVLSEYIRILR